LDVVAVGISSGVLFIEKESFLKSREEGKETGLKVYLKYNYLLIKC